MRFLSAGRDDTLLHAYQHFTPSRHSRRSRWECSIVFWGHQHINRHISTGTRISDRQVSHALRYPYEDDTAAGSYCAVDATRRYLLAVLGPISRTVRMDRTE